MQTFTDNAGHTWTLSLTFGSAKRVQALLDVNLLELEGGSPPLLTRLGTDVMLLCDVIFALLKPQADEKDVTDEAWAEAMGGDAILAAQGALYAELTDFTRRRGRTDVTRAVQAQQAMIEMAIKASEEKIEAIDAQHEIDLIFADSDTSSPESSE